MRKRRVLQEGAVYHVTARINRGEMALLAAEEKALFITVLGQAKKKYRFHVVNFCIMNNHFHLMIKPQETESLSKIMQWILSVFAMRWNRRHHLSGHVWGDRFFSRIISKIKDFLSIFQYIDENPVSAHLVEHTREWEFGGLWHHKKHMFEIVEKPDSLIQMFFPEHVLDG
jgi:putative transposase